MKQIIGTFILLVALQQVWGQNCVNCPGSTPPTGSASVLGEQAFASGNSAFAAGFQARAEQNGSIALGLYAKSTYSNAMAFGINVTAANSNSIVIGNGFAQLSPLINNVPNSLMIGFGSTKPTFFVGTSPSSVTTGRIGIGDITAPQAKLHIKADAGEPATLRLEATGTSGDNIYSRMLFTPNHSIQAANNQNLTFSTQSTKHFVFQNGYVGIGVTNPAKPLDVQGDVRASGSFFMGDNPIRSSQWENFESDVFYNQGNVGIGTNATNGYKLAVKGKIISEEVVVKFYSTWPDYVFANDYDLIPIHELENYIISNGHLPQIPTAETIAEEGISIGEMNALLLKKIEELTLYIIQIQKDIEFLRKENNQLELLK